MKGGETGYQKVFLTDSNYIFEKYTGDHDNS